MNILDEVGSLPMLPASRIERASVGGGVADLAAGLLQFNSGQIVIVAGDDIAEPGVDEAIAKVARLLGAPVYGSSWLSATTTPQPILSGAVRCPPPPKKFLKLSVTTIACSAWEERR